MDWQPTRLRQARLPIQATAVTAALFRRWAFLPDGKTLISCGAGVDVLIQELDIGDPPTAAIAGPTDAVSGSFDIDDCIQRSRSLASRRPTFTITNGSAHLFNRQRNASYTRPKSPLTPLFEGTVTVSIPAGAAQDVDKEGSLAASFEASAELGAPTAAVTGPDGPVGLGAFEIQIEFNQEVSGLEAGDIVVTGRNRRRSVTGSRRRIRGVDNAQRGRR